MLLVREVICVKEMYYMGFSRKWKLETLSQTGLYSTCNTHKVQSGKVMRLGNGSEQREQIWGKKRKQEESNSKGCGGQYLLHNAVHLAILYADLIAHVESHVPQVTNNAADLF